MTPAQSWRLNYNNAVEQFKSSGDIVIFTERLWQLGFRRQDIHREIALYQQLPPYNPGFHSGLAPDTRY